MKINLMGNRSNDAKNTIIADAHDHDAETSDGTAHGFSRRDAVRYITGAGVAGLTASVLTGCGGSGSAGSSLVSSTLGRATLVITWPTRTSTTSRLIPVEANSIVAIFSLNGTVEATQTIARPTTGTQTTVTFPNLPPGKLTLQATAYPNTDGTGTADATATTTVTIVAAQNTAAAITMASTIDHLTITPTSPTVAVGGTTTLSVAAIDASGNIVLTSASTITWTAVTSAYASVTSAGVVTGVAAGTAQIMVTETESGKTATVSVAVTAATTTPHAVTPEGEIGPYFTDDSASGYNRSNILANLDGTDVQAGVPLVLSIYVYDTENGNAAMQGVQIDIWHCNAAGVYSNESVESTLGQSWLRGYQLTDAAGFATFTTIVPGWYQGRTTHVHLRVRSKYSEASSTSDGTNTTQFFFPQATINYLATNVAPYKSEGTNSTTNANDHVYTPETLGETQMTLTGDYNTGYAATVAIYLPITSE